MLETLKRACRTYVRFGMALAVAALAMMLPAGPAHAACVFMDAPANNVVSCSGNVAGNQTFTTQANDWVYRLLGAPDPVANINGSVTVTNNGDFNGTFQMDEGTSIAPAANVNALVIQNNTPGDSLVTVNINGSVINNNAANQNFDALRLQNGWNYIVNIGTTGTLTGNDDGLVVTSVANSVIINNAGVITARGQAGGSNGGEAILVAQGGTQNAYVAGSVTFSNTGKIESLGTTLGGQAAHIAASGAIVVSNEYRFDPEGEIIIGTGQILGGTEGLRLNSQTSVEFTNKAYVQSALGDSVQAVVTGTSGGITVTNDETGEIVSLDTGASGGDGIEATITNSASGESIEITNLGHIEAVGSGIVTSHAGTGTTIIRNLSMQTIVSNLNGIDAIGAGGDLVVFNGDGGVDNPDGRIEAGEIGINAFNSNGGNVTVWNGTGPGTQSQIIAKGDYGIFARSQGDGVDDGDAQVKVSNFGLVQADGNGAVAVVHARTTADVGDSYVEVWNGGGPAIATLARLNGYGIDDTDPENSVPVIFDANGVELIKFSGTGGQEITIPYFETRHVGVALSNFGAWDFYGYGGNYLLDTGNGGGIYAPGGSAVVVRHFGDSDSLIYNSGTIIGQGNSFDPVLDIRTQYFAEGADSFEDENQQLVAVPNAVIIFNKTDYDVGTLAVMGSAALPSHFNFAGVSASHLLYADLTAFRVASNDHLLHASGAPVLFYNDGLIVGRMRLETEGDGNVIVNDGAWFTSGINRFFGGADDAVANFGVIRTAFDPTIEEETHFRGLNYLYNAGLISMIDGEVGDYTRTTGDYEGDYGLLGVDANLAAPGSTADMLSIGGESSGSTGVIVHDTNSGAGYYNPEGILIAHVEGDDVPNGTFFLANGPIDKGFFTYDLYGVPGGSVDWLLASTPNERAFELAKLTTGAQAIWYESSGVWLDRTADLRRMADCAVVPDRVPMKLGAKDESLAAVPCAQKRYGSWLRGFGGSFDRSATDTAALFDVTHTLNGNYDQDMWGIEGGMDVMLSRPGSGYGALYVGVLGGYVKSDMRFSATGDKADFDGGMVGVYGTYMAGPWYADLLFKADFLDVDYQTTFQGESASSNVHAYGLRLDTGYRMNLQRGFFLEPQGTIAWMSADADSLTLLNARADQSDGESVRGRLALRAGASWQTARAVFEPFATASLWHEFAGDNSVALQSGEYVLKLTDGLDKTWGELGGGINVIGDNASLFIKADALVGGDVDGFSVKGGGRVGW